MQFIPSTGAQVAKAAGLRSFTVEDLYEPSVALRLGARHLRELLDRFGGDTISAVAAYNGGAGAVERWRRDFGHLEPAAFVETIPFGETRKYVKKVLTALDAYGRLDPPGLWPENRLDSVKSR
jgi:soluble lytic murein transglycosylase